MVKLGVLFIVLSVVVLLVMLFSPDILSPLAPLLCPSGQTLTSESDTFNPSPGETDTTISYFCTKSNGNRMADVSGTMTAITMGIFFVILAIGIGLTILGSSRAQRQSATVFGRQVDLRTDDERRYSSRRNVSDYPAVSDLAAGLQHGVIRFGGQEIHVDDLKSGNYQLGQATQRTLAETLRQLDDAHTQALITDDEYQKLRAEALDKLI